MTPLTITVLIFYVISFGLSTFIGIDPYHSFWDNHERMLGFFTILHYVVFYLLCGQMFKNWTDWKWAARFFLFGGFIVMFVALLQVGSPDLLLNQGSPRVASTLGNPIYVGGYALFLTFLSALLFIKDNNRIWKGVYVFFSIFSFLGIFYSGTRGSILALLAGVGTAVLVYAIALRNKPKIRSVLFGLITIGIILLGILYVNRQTEFVKNIPAVGRAVNTSMFDIKESARWIAWEIAWDSFLEKPVFGWGPNNYFYAFNLHYNPKSLEHGYGETWFDNAHNIVMNTLAVQGALGILSYFGLFIVAIIMLTIAFRKKIIDAHVLALGSGFVIAHFVGNVTVFENITSYLYFMFWLAMINQLAMNKEQSAVEKAPEDKKISAGIITAVGIIAVIIIFIFNIQPARANMKTLDAIKALSSDPVLGLEKMKTALYFGSPHIDDIRSDIARTAAQMLYSYGQQLNQDVVKNICSLTYAELQKNTVLHPLDVRNFISLAQLAQYKAYLENNGLYLQESENYLKQALDASPRRQQVEYSLAMLYVQEQRYEEAIKLLEQTMNDDPKIGETYWRLAYVYKLSGDEAKAKRVLADAANSDVVFSEQDQATIAQIFPSTSTQTSTSK